MCKPLPVGALMGCLFIGGNGITFFGILIWTELVDFTDGEINYARRSDLHTSVQTLREFQHQAGNHCLILCRIVVLIYPFTCKFD